jgi:hypothetical protein
VRYSYGVHLHDVNHDKCDSMSHKQDREGLTQRLIGAWTMSHQEATAAGHRLTAEEDLPSSLFDLSEALGYGRWEIAGFLSTRSQQERWEFQERHLQEIRAREPLAWATPVREATCAGCGHPFRIQRADARSCSPACRQRVYRARARAASGGVRSAN